MAALARTLGEEGPGPLVGLHPEALLKGARSALDAGLVDDLDWLTPAKAGAALYELASALPLGAEQRELGRRVLARLLAGNAEVFVTIATRMALGTGKGLGTPAMRARIALVAELPFGHQVADGPLALALAQRRDLAREWVEIPSTGSLPARRLASRLLERAAREAARRASQGDPHALRAFKVDAVGKAWGRLLADRESLVWRHIAVARGLLAPFVPELASEIDAAFDPALTPTEWRRGAASVVALAAVDPEQATVRIARTLEGGLLERDPGAAAAFVWGIARAAEAEPEAADAILSRILSSAPDPAAEAVLELGTELGDAPLVDRARAKIFERKPKDDEPVREQLGRALAAFATDGARAAYGAAREVLASATGAVEALEAGAVDEDAADDRAASLANRTSSALLHDLDASLLERAALDDLLGLGTVAEQVKSHDESLDALRGRLCEWILAREAAPLGGGASSVKHADLRLRRLRALLHLADSDVGAAPEDGARAARLRERWRRVASALVVRFERESPNVLHRAVSAGLARALDALVRAGACDLSDALLFVARTETDPTELATLAEASMDPDLVHVFSRYAEFLRASRTGPPLAALEELARELLPDGSGRREALRTVLVRLHAALAAVEAAPALRALSPRGSEPEVLTALETYVGALAQLSAGARTRVQPEASSRSSLPAPETEISLAVSRVLAGADPALERGAVDAWVASMSERIPAGIASVAGGVVRGLVERPVDRSDSAIPLVRLTEAQLPAWLPARRTMGAFYVLRTLGAGAVGSVFIVVRAEDKGEPNAERFALKVPDYSATAARSLSEAEFLQLFRAEASALMQVPPHRNLARFVTFDLSARPKPILVMELVEGEQLERVVASRTLTVPRALGVLDDMLGGLEAMHAVGVGHLDLKPSNVILRDGHEAVLVDFGLAGRHLRPGCATGPYGAPEVWGVVPDHVTPEPPPADVYAFGCVAFEVLTGRVLFDAPNEVAQIGLHVAHDGLPPPLRALGEHPEIAPLAELLHGTLRRDPRQRPTVQLLRARLRELAPTLAGVAWPLLGAH